MSRMRVAFTGTVCVLALAGSVVLGAQETSAPAAVVSAADCLRNRQQARDCQQLGVRYLTGAGVTQDLTQAIVLLDAACRTGLRSACWQQGWALLKRHESSEDVERGRTLLEQSCKRSDSGACALLGRAYAEGTGLARDAPRAVKPLDTACAAGQGVACLVLATLLDAGDGVSRDAERAKQLVAKGCVLGTADACERACDTGDGDACQALGRLLVQAEEPDAGRINRAYERACNAAVAESCFSLGMRTRDKDAERALPLFERACSLDDAPGCVAAGHAYYLGRGVAADPTAAARLYTKGCEKDFIPACVSLGGMYARGELGADETARGQAFLVKACRGDVECRAILANGRIPKAWGGSLEALRPRQITRGDGPARVGGLIHAPKKIKDVAPIYPPKARQARIQGTVTLECVISPRGDVTNLRVVNSIPLLDAAAVAAVRQWRYTPTLLDGEPVPVIMTVTVNFGIR